MLGRVTVFFLLIFCTSCELFSPKLSTSKSNLQVLDTVIDYTTVDVYPLFTACQDFTESEAQKKCFETTLIESISNSLTTSEYVVKEPVNDTTFIDLLVDNNGKVKIIAINSPEKIKKNLPKLDSLLRSSAANIPLMKPAIKRGIPINSQYKLSVVIKTID